MNLLIVAGHAVSEIKDLPAGITALLAHASAILVMSPSLPGRLAFMVSDVDRARGIADERLAVVLSQLEGGGYSAAGVRGDEGPITAFADAIAQFGPDHILIGMRSAEHRSWQERNLIDRVLERFHLPITVFTIDESGKVQTPPA